MDEKSAKEEDAQRLPRWAVWRALPHAQLWQAVALSLNREPVEAMLDAPSLYSRTSLAAEFRRRLKDCLRAVSAVGPIKTQGSRFGRMSRSHRCVVLVSEVAAFLVLAGYTVPDEMRDLPPPTVAAAPTESNMAPAANGTKKLWTPERLEQLRSYREKHGTSAAAKQFGVSDSRVRALLPGDKPQPKGYSAFNPRVK